MTFDPASRYRLTQQATKNPGFCLITRVTAGPLIDTGLDLNKFDSIWAETNQARVYLSVDAVREMAEGAGLFDEDRARSAAREAEAYTRGFAEGMKEHGDLAAYADRLADAAERIRAGLAGAGPEASGDGEDAEPAVLVVDGPARPARKRGASTARKPAGQDDRPRRERRPAGVSSDSGDGSGNPFRVR